MFVKKNHDQNNFSSDELIKSINRIFFLIIICIIISATLMYKIHLISNSENNVRFMNFANEAIRAVETLSNCTDEEQYAASIHDYFRTIKEEKNSLYPPECCFRDIKGKYESGIREACDKYEEQVTRSQKDFPKERVFFVANNPVLPNQCVVVLIRKKALAMPQETILLGRYGQETVKIPPERSYLATVQCGNDKSTTESFFIDDLSTKYVKNIQLKIRTEYWEKFLLNPLQGRDSGSCHDSEEFIKGIPFYENSMKWTDGCYLGNAYEFLAPALRNSLAKVTDKEIPYKRTENIEELLQIALDRHIVQGMGNVSVFAVSGITLHSSVILIANTVTCMVFVFILFLRSIRLTNLKNAQYIPSFVLDSGSFAEKVMMNISHMLLISAPIFCGLSYANSVGSRLFIPTFHSLFSSNPLIFNADGEITSRYDFWLSTLGLLVIFLFSCLMITAVLNFRNYARITQASSHEPIGINDGPESSSLPPESPTILACPRKTRDSRLLWPKRNSSMWRAWIHHRRSQKADQCPGSQEHPNG